MSTPTILDATLSDLLFAHWFAQKRLRMGQAALAGDAYRNHVPTWLDQRLDELRPQRNPHLGCFLLDGRHGPSEYPSHTWLPWTFYRPHWSMLP